MHCIQTTRWQRNIFLIVSTHNHMMYKNNKSLVQINLSKTPNLRAREFVQIRFVLTHEIKTYDYIMR